VDDAIVFLENTVRRLERGETVLDATLNGPEISFTILSMTISLAAVFIPLVFMTGLVGDLPRVRRHHRVHLRSGLVSLTLTPLMCARMLKERGEGTKKTWMERVIAGSRSGARRLRSVALVVPAASLGLGDRLGAVSPARSCCHAIPRPSCPRDSSVVFGVFIGKEGFLPGRCTHPGPVDDALHQDPNVLMDFTMTGNSNFVASNQGSPSPS